MALYAAFTKFEKQHGTRSALENTVLGKRRIQYEDELSQDGRNYDVWFDYSRLEEGALKDLREEGAATDEEEKAIARVREIYERAVGQVPPGSEKRHWRRYIFLWLNYALFEEIETKVCIIIFSPLVFIVHRSPNRIILVPTKYIKPQSPSCHIKYSPSQNSGLCTLGLKYVVWI